MKIPALRVEVNGKVVALAGAEGLDILSGTVAFGASPTGGIEVSRVQCLVMGLGALRGSNPQQLTSGHQIKLKLGDRITFEIAEVDQPTAPETVLRTPSSDDLAAIAAAEKTKASRR